MKLVWFRNDLRVHDNPALSDAVGSGESVLALFVHTPEQDRQTHHESFAKQALRLASLRELASALADLAIPLIWRQCPSYQEVPDCLASVCQRYAVDQLFFNSELLLNEQRRDHACRQRLEGEGVAVQTRHCETIIRPGQIRTQTDQMYKVFTPYKRSWIERLQQQGFEVRAIPDACARAARLDDDEALPDWQALIETSGSPGYRDDLWPAGEQAALARLRSFIEGKVDDYAEQRNTPSVAGTSGLSMYLAIGCLSPTQCLAALQSAHEGQESLFDDVWLSELIWREFYREIIHARPELVRGKAFNDKALDQWGDYPDRLAAWQEGRTGFPIVDAAMRQLNQTGWMHNRLRMVAAQFLNKLCWVDWRCGERYFMQTLIDGDFASNNGGWQWCSSTGADSVPYFRIMNPTAQSKTHDPDGTFIRRFVPELDTLDSKAIHCPTDQARADLGYPGPIIDYASARREALEQLSSHGGRPHAR